MDEREFRTALSSFATGVTIVTAAGDNCPVGMTVSSFNSVSMQPPLVLWSVTKTTDSCEIFRHAEHYCIHVLSSDQQWMATRFATAGIDKYEGVDFICNRNGVPVLRGSAARFDCKKWAVYEGGDHWIIVGEVRSFEKTNAESLIFCEGSFGTVNAIRQSGGETDKWADDGDSPIDHLLLYNLSRAYHQMSRQFHATVRHSGLSIPQWRILASLYGLVCREFEDLQARTFLDPEALNDQLVILQKEGLCKVESNSATIRGTERGQERVRHLFELGRQQELKAIDEQSLAELISHLSLVVENTTRIR